MITLRIMIYVCAGLLLAVLGLAARVWWLDSALDAAREQRGLAQRNHAACVDANTAWSGTVDIVQGALHQCSRERDAIRDSGRESLARASVRQTALEQQIATWRSASAAAEQLPHCRAVLDLELCPELADY